MFLEGREGWKYCEHLRLPSVLCAKIFILEKRVLPLLPLNRKALPLNGRGSGQSLIICRMESSSRFRKVSRKFLICCGDLKQ